MVVWLLLVLSTILLLKGLGLISFLLLSQTSISLGPGKSLLILPGRDIMLLRHLSLLYDL